MLSQALAITRVSLKSIPDRWAPSLVIVIGLAGVVAVFTALLAMATGFESTLKATGRSDVVIVMRGGSDAELNSALLRDQTDLVEQGPGIRSGADGKPLASAELMIIAELIRKDDVKNGANITVRGVEPTAFPLRPNLKIIAGRNFTPGLRELIVGRGVLRQFQGAEIGKTVRMRGSNWTVVGEFESGDSHDSELWTDINVARTTFGRWVPVRCSPHWMARVASRSCKSALDGGPAADRGRDARDGLLRRPDQAVPQDDRLAGGRGHHHHGARSGIRGAQQHVRGGCRARQGDRHAARDWFRRPAGGDFGDDRGAAARDGRGNTRAR